MVIAKPSYGATRTRFAVGVLIFGLVMALLCAPLGAQPRPPIQSSGTVPALSTTIDTSNFDIILERMQSAVETMSEKIQAVTTALLLTLSVLEFIWMLSKAVINQTGLAGMMSKVIFRIVIIGIALYFIEYVPEHVGVLMASTKELAATASGEVIDPKVSGILKEGLSLAFDLIAKASGWRPDIAIALFICAIIVVIIHAGIAAFIILAYAELYLISIAGFVLLAFFGLSGTENTGKAFIMALIAKALKILTMLITYGLIKEIIDTTMTQDVGLAEALQLIAILIIMLLLLMSLPTAVESLVSPYAKSSAAEMAGGAAMGAAKTATGVAVGVAAGAAIGAAAGGVKAGAEALKAGGSLGSIAKTAGMGAAKSGLTGGGKGGVSGFKGKLGADAANKLLSKLNLNK